MYQGHRGTLATGGFFATEDQAGGTGFGDELSVFVGDFAFDIADSAAALDDTAFGAEFGFANRPQIVDFEFDRRERFLGREGAGESKAHGGVGDVAENSAMQRAHGIEVLRAGLQGDDCAAVARFQRFKTDQVADGCAMLHHTLEERLRWCGSGIGHDGVSGFYGDWMQQNAIRGHMENSEMLLARLSEPRNGAVARPD